MISDPGNAIVEGLVCEGDPFSDKQIDKLKKELDKTMLAKLKLEKNNGRF